MQELVFWLHCCLNFHSRPNAGIWPLTFWPCTGALHRSWQQQQEDIQRWRPGSGSGSGCSLKTTIEPQHCSHFSESQTKKLMLRSTLCFHTCTHAGVCWPLQTQRTLGNEVRCSLDGRVPLSAVGVVVMVWVDASLWAPAVGIPCFTHHYWTADVYLSETGHTVSISADVQLPPLVEQEQSCSQTFASPSQPRRKHKCHSLINFMCFCTVFLL